MPTQPASFTTVCSRTGTTPREAEEEEKEKVEGVAGLGGQEPGHLVEARARVASKVARAKVASRRQRSRAQVRRRKEVSLQEAQEEGRALLELPGAEPGWERPRSSRTSWLR